MREGNSSSRSGAVVLGLGLFSPKLLAVAMSIYHGLHRHMRLKSPIELATGDLFAVNMPQSEDLRGQIAELVGRSLQQYPGDRYDAAAAISRIAGKCVGKSGNPTESVKALIAGGKMTDVTVQEISRALSITRQAAQKRLNGAHFAVRFGQKFYPRTSLPADVQAALYVEPAPSQANHDRMLAASPAQRAIALQRAEVCDTVGVYQSAGMTRSAAINRAAIANNADRASLYRWLLRVKGAPRGDWAPLLLDSESTRGREKIVMTPEAWDALITDVLQTTRRPLKSAYHDLLVVGKDKGWIIPAYRTVLRRYQELDPAAVTLARHGPDALDKLYPAQKRDRTIFKVGQALCADGHKFDCWVHKDGKIIRPIIVAWQCLRSAKILSYRIAETEHSDVTRLSFLDACEHYTVPEFVYLDNGRGFTALMLTGGATHRFRFRGEPDEMKGLFVQCGTDPRFTKPYNGRAKPIERSWKDLINHIEKHPVCIGAYTGSNPLDKPARTTAVEWKKFQALVAQQVQAHNERTGRTGQDYAGRSFDQLFAEGWASVVPRKLTRWQLDLWRHTPQAVTVPSKGKSPVVSYRTNGYWSDLLQRYAGQKVLLRLDPENLKAGANAYTLDGEFIAALKCVSEGAFNSSEAARDHNRARKDWENSKKRVLEAERRLSVKQLQELYEPKALEEAEPLKASGNVVAPAFQQVRDVKKLTNEQREMIAKMEESQADELAQMRNRKHAS